MSGRIDSPLGDAVGEYCGSQHFLLLDDELKEQAEGLLAYWCEQMGPDPSARGVVAALHSVGQLDAPLAARRGFPRLLQGFLEYVAANRPVAGADRWADIAAGAEAEYLAGFRDDGTVRGQTVRHTVAAVGRNDPCPCGSGKKFKKCCMPR